MTAQNLTRRSNAPIRREKKLSSEIDLTADMQRPSRKTGRDSWACRLTGRSLSPTFTFPTSGTNLSIETSGQEGTTGSYLRENEPRRGQFGLRRPATPLSA